MGKRLTGGVIYEGPSMLDGKPIVVVLTGFRRSKNSKTGPMLQCWIMRADIDPGEAINVGADASICGDCPQRRNQGGACYVVVEQAPLAVWRAWKRGTYRDWRDRFPDNRLKGWAVRFGAYGDPAAVPLTVWNRIRAQKITGWTGYTHQWRNSPALRPFLMASVDSEAEMHEAQNAGWRTFRVRLEDEPIVKASEVDCPSERVQCSDCGLCKGRKMLAKSVTIQAHGYLLVRLLKRQRLLPTAVPVAG